MAEYFVGPVMGKLIDLGFSYSEDQFRWQTGMKEELRKLREIHPQIQAVVSAYNQVEIKDPALNQWLWQLRDAIDEADDVFDEFDYSKREKEASKNKRKRKAEVAAQRRASRSKKLRKVRSVMKHLKKKLIEIYKRALRIDPNLKRLEVAVQKLYQISAKFHTFLHLIDLEKQEQKQQQYELHNNREMGSMPTTVLLGRSREMERVIQWLRNPYQAASSAKTEFFFNNISLLSVVGRGGTGKTTLLQHVYEDGVTTLFEVKMWASISTNFNAKTVIANILRSLQKQVPDEAPLEALQSSLQSEVMYKRFLLVLDDIWEEDGTKLKKLLAPLHCGSSDSRILITTRMNSVASTFAKIIRDSETLQLKDLEKEECLRVFSTHAFAGVENPDDEFISIAKMMVENFSSCPLAAKVIGDIMNSCVDISYWRNVSNTDIWNVERDKNDLLPILKLSYTYLPKFLQNCFSFCSIFPRDHKFNKDDLVQMWIALGFIQSSNIEGETSEDTGRRYFNILVQKSFFEEFTYEDRVYYKMDDLSHQLAQFVSAQECARVVDDKKLAILPKTIRHLIIKIHGNVKAAIQKIRTFKNLRSLFLFRPDVGGLDENVISEIIKASKSIRLLVISTLDPPKMLEISSLIHLRYFRVECANGTLQLPRSISHLYHLQFIISQKLQILEMDVIGLKELKNNENCQLIIYEFVIKDPSELLMEMLNGICSFRALTIQENDELVAFQTETEQWLLHHSLFLFELRFNELQSLESLPSCLESLSSLQILCVYDIPKLKLLPNPPDSLTTLELLNLESLQCLPSSLSTISSLKTLRLKNTPLLLSLPDLPASVKTLELQSLQCLPPSLSTISSLTVLTLSHIPHLESLPDLPSSLKTLELHNLESLQCLPSSLSTISSLRTLQLRNIPLLKSLPDLPSSLTELYMITLENLVCLPSCLPTLRALWIAQVPQLLELPRLPSLERLSIEGCHPQLMERYPNFDEIH